MAYLRQVRLEGTVRTVAERRYVRGRPVRFPGTVADATPLIVEVQLLAQVLESTELAATSAAGVKPLRLSDREVEAELGQALGVARIKALTALGDDARAVASARRHWRVTDPLGRVLESREGSRVE